MTLDDRNRKWGMLRMALSNGDVELLENYIKNSSWQAVNVSDSDGMTPLAVAVSAPVNALPMVKLLCKNGADPRLGSYPLILLMGAEHRDVREFFRSRHDYVCNLHFFELMNIEEVKEALRHTLLLGYRMHANASSPLQLALSSSDERARLIADASKPWSPSTHELWPHKQRMLALELLVIGVRLRNQNSCWQQLADPWVHQILPKVIGNRVATDFWAICFTTIKFILLLKRRVVN